MKLLSAGDAALKKDLDRRYKKTNRPAFIPGDPVKFPRRYTKSSDIEIAAFLAAAIAWGRRDLILRSAERMFALMETGPFDFVMSAGALLSGTSLWENSGYSDNNNGNKPRGRCIHRTFFESDLRYFCRGFRFCYEKYGGLEKIFSEAPDIWKGIALFRDEMAAANGGLYTKHIANPGGLNPENAAGASACKRIHLALRWLVRKGPVDMGLWKNISPSALYIPLDLHVARTARRLGLLDRKSNDKKAVIALTEKLREFCPEDPVKYDFALFSSSPPENDG
ncbi:MAG: TIGR02757 family protein [Treponema sp.]|jgi:uncharacterized protein (TIGR02757 family)|nr:TIGR02757 family protein [Treponema sp.]